VESLSQILWDKHIYRIFRRTRHDFLPQKQLCHVHCVLYEGALYIQNLPGRSWKICENKKLSTGYNINWSKPCIPNWIAAKPAEIGLNACLHACFCFNSPTYHVLRIHSLAHCSEVNAMKKTHQILRMISGVRETSLINMFTADQFIMACVVCKSLPYKELPLQNLQKSYVFVYCYVLKERFTGRLSSASRIN
jgi:hypothetical protein